MQHQTQLRRFGKSKEFDQELEDFKKKHSDAFNYFLEEYGKWVQLKNKVNAQLRE